MGRSIKLSEDNTDDRKLRQISDALSTGAIVIYPTDSLYAMGCSLEAIKSIARIKQLKGKHDDNLSIICHSLQQASKYVKIDNSSFKVLRDHTPAPITFIMNATSLVPNKFLDGKKQVGIRITSNPITAQIIEQLGIPLVTTSLPTKSLENEDMGNVELLYEEYGDLVDLFIDGGDAESEPTTVVMLDDGELTLLREGKYIF